jgi:prepilin-type N-terminal cleavage/methylation domain-containing protein
MRDMRPREVLNNRGVTLIEMLVALIIFGMASAAIYRVFVGQSRAYVVDEQVVDVQQEVRTAVELLKRDLMMAGYKNDSTPITVNRPIFPGKYDFTVTDSAVRIEYEHEDDTGNPNTLYTIVYYTNGGQIIRELYVNNVLNSTDLLLDNVAAFTFNYGLDIDESGQFDGAVEQWVPASNVNDRRVISVEFVLAARPDPVNPDLEKISPRTLTSRISLRNPMLKHIRDKI